MKQLFLLTIFFTSIACTTYSQTKVVQASRVEQRWEDGIYKSPEIAPKFIGGDSTWKNFLKENLNYYAASDGNAPAGTYPVIVQFIVNKNGSLSDFRALTQVGYGLEKEILKLMKKSPKWEPAQHNGEIVRCIKRVQVTFTQLTK